MGVLGAAGASEPDDTTALTVTSEREPEHHPLVKGLLLFLSGFFGLRIGS